MMPIEAKRFKEEGVDLEEMPGHSGMIRFPQWIADELEDEGLNPRSRYICYRCTDDSWQRWLQKKRSSWYKDRQGEVVPPTVKRHFYGSYTGWLHKKYDEVGSVRREEEMNNRAMGSLFGFQFSTHTTWFYEDWALFEIEPDQGVDVLKKEFRRIAKRFHPDGSEPNEEEFLKYRDAYKRIRGEE